MTTVDEIGWPVATTSDLTRKCSRPECNDAEFRIHGYCSVYCEDLHDAEQEIARLKALLRRVPAEFTEQERYSRYVAGHETATGELIALGTFPVALLEEIEAAAKE